MASSKSKFDVGDVVFHKSAEEKAQGVVIAVRLIEVDWGPEVGSVVHHEDTLTDKFVPKFGDG